MVKAVIIDDEENVRNLHKQLLNDNFPDIKVVAEADSVEGGIKAIQLNDPDIVLLDIEIKGGTGFNVLQKCKPYHFKLVFITAFNDFAIKAIKFSAMDYILKPVNEFEFIQSIETILERIGQQETEKQLDNFMEHYEKKTQSKKLVLRTSEAMHLVDIADILYCKSDNSYTTFYIKDQKEVIVSKGLKEYADLLESFDFLRPHQSYLVNLHAIRMVDKADGGFIIMNNGREVPVSSRRKQLLLTRLDQL